MSVSASKSALLLSPCLRWAGDSAREYDEKNVDTTKRDKGTLFHLAMETYYTSGDKWLKVCFHDTEVTGWVRSAIEWSKKHLEPRCETIETEVYVAYNFAKGTVHTDRKVRNRKYPRKPSFLPGTADLVCVLGDGSLYVADWKTGGGTGADKQLLTLASGLRKVYPKPDGSLRDVRLAILYAGGESGDVFPVEWAVTESDLLSHQYAMAFQLADIGKRNDPVVGIHCSQLYCNHLAYCPGVTAIVEDLSESPQALLQPQSLVRKHAMTDMPISDEEAGYTMERITAARRQMKYYEEAIRKYCKDGGKAVSGDFEFKQTNSGFRWVKRER